MKQIKYLTLFLIISTILSVYATDKEKRNRLFSAEANASSYLKTNWNKFNENYHPNYILDDNPKTAWVEGDEGDGENASISYNVSTVSNVQEMVLSIRNGFQYSKALFKANSRVKKLKIELLYKQTVAFHQSVSLKDEWGWQDVTLNPPAKITFEEIRLTIESVYAGTTYKDTCISDIQTYIPPIPGYNLKIEASKQTQLKKWIENREKDAKFFKKMPVEYPFAGSQFKHKYLANKEVPENMRKNFQKNSEYFSNLLLQMKDQSKLYQFLPAKNQTKIPEGAYNLNLVAGYIDSSMISIFETKTAKLEKIVASTDEYQPCKIFQTAAKVSFYENNLQKPQYVSYNRRLVCEERTTWTEDAEVLLVYDENQRLKYVYSETENSNDFEEEAEAKQKPQEKRKFISLLSFEYNAKKKIQKYSIMSSELLEEGTVSGSEYSVIN